MASPAPAGDPFEALGDPNRRAILQLLSGEGRSVQQIADELPISRPAVSRHLRLLKQAGLVDSVVDGTRHVYRVRPEGVASLREYMDQLWREASARYALAVENLGPEEP
jgi:DNA-binding transcriptional ArsR family regulator